MYLHLFKKSSSDFVSFQDTTLPSHESGVIFSVGEDKGSGILYLCLGDSVTLEGRTHSILLGSTKSRSECFLSSYRYMKCLTDNSGLIFSIKIHFVNFIFCFILDNKYRRLEPVFSSIINSENTYLLFVYDSYYLGYQSSSFLNCVLRSKIESPV